MEPMRLLVLLGALLAGSLPAQDTPLPVRTKVDLVALDSHAVPGQTLRLAFRFRCDPHFHIYWVNPGDAGEAPKWTWTESAGLRFSPEIRWPAPIRIDLSGVLNFCYEGETHLFFDAEVPAEAKGALKLRAKVEWLECDDKGCYPQETEVSLEIPVGPSAAPRITPGIQASLDRLPTETLVVQGKVAADRNSIRLTETLAGRALRTVLAPEEFFPLRSFVASSTLPGPVAMTAATVDGKSVAQAIGSLSLRDAAEELDDGLLGYVALVKDNLAGKSRWVTVRIDLDGQPAPAGEAPSAPAPKAPASGLEWKPWSPEAQAKALAAGKTVYVDFTARWCATCQVNKRVYGDARLAADLAEANVVLLKADWDKRDEVIRAELARHGRQGIPLNVFLRPGADPVILPEILTAGIVREGLAASLAGRRLEVAESSAAGMLLLAFLGGAILNLMPCVFPVIGLKVLGFAGQAGGSRAAAVRQSLVYALGVVLSFLALGLLILALKSGGTAVGWGFQMQSPGFVLGTAVLMVLLGMSLAGAYEIGTGLASTAAASGNSGAFLSGVLATAVATPCTAPGLGAALGYALDDRRGSAETLAFFAVIGLGMALPYVLLVSFPALARRLPKPGEWMETLKQAMAFPLFAYALYLLWVLSAQVDDASWVRDAGIGLSVVAAACWVWGRWGAPHRGERERLWGRLAGAALLAATLAHLYWHLPA
jgi:DsbC/DsbD-like thiol-disulfide interchange protein/cytochrome c biogenesis protein CcdA